MPVEQPKVKRNVCEWPIFRPNVYSLRLLAIDSQESGDKKMFYLQLAHLFQVVGRTCDFRVPTGEEIIKRVTASEPNGSLGTTHLIQY